MGISGVDNPLLLQSDFPLFDGVEASHVRPGIRSILKELVGITLVFAASSKRDVVVAQGCN